MFKQIKALFFSFILLFYSLYKYLLHLITGKCTLLRIIHSKFSNAKKYILLESNIESSVKLDKSKILVDIMEDKLKDNVLDVIKSKNVKDEFHEEFSYYITNTCHLHVKYKSLISEVTLLKNQKVDIENIEHKHHLLLIWKTLKPDIEMDPAFISKLWSEIGFQGTNPQTDFRGMGTLGLIQLEYFAVNSPHTAEEIISNSRDNSQGFPLAIAAINFTALLFGMLCDHRLKLYFYSLPIDSINLKTFNNLFVAAFNAFHEHWCTDNPGVMQFNIEKDKFETVLSNELNDESIIHKYI